MAFLSKMKQGFGSSFTFFSESWAELKKVRWPTRRELISYTIVVMVTVTLITLYFAVIDYLISGALRWLFNE